jgi:hypothetical protein
VAQLEKRFFTLQANYNQLEETYNMVRKEYKSLLDLLKTHPTPSNTPPQRSLEPVLTLAAKSSHGVNEFSLCEQELDRVLAFKSEDEPASTDCLHCTG